MQKVNYQHELDKTLDKICLNKLRPKLLIHACCAPCSSYVLEYLHEYFDITLFYYNPNIYPKDEFEKRTVELNRLVPQMLPSKNIHIIEGVYEPEVFFSAVKGLELEPERGKRCEICFRLRLEKSALTAKELGMDFFTTTLSISPMKDAELLNMIGGELGDKYGVKYLFSDFKKRGGYKRSIELSRKYSLYRQNYCGCIFSKKK